MKHITEDSEIQLYFLNADKQNGRLRSLINIVSYDKNNLTNIQVHKMYWTTNQKKKKKS